MKTRKILIGIAILFIFLGGFFSGILFVLKDKQAPLPQRKLSHSKTNPFPKQLPNLKQEKSKVLMGYIQDFRDPNMVDYSKLTHLIFSFAHPTKDGKIIFNNDWALKNLKAHVANAKQHNTKVILAVGGWYHINGGESYNYFKAAISNPSTRTSLVNELVRFIDREHLDGVDIDFEHPRSTADAENLTAFVKELKDKLRPKQKELSVAVHAKIHGETLTEAHFVKYNTAMFAYVDHVNIMAYDGQWDGGYNAANLSPYPFTEKIVHYWTRLFETNHLDKGKLVLGVPSYAQPENPESKQVSYATIVKNHPENINSDQVQLNGITYHFNGNATIKKKTKLALDHGFGGMMLWELGLDSTGATSLTSFIFTSINS